MSQPSALHPDPALRPDPAPGRPALPDRGRLRRAVTTPAIVLALLSTIAPTAAAESPDRGWVTVNERSADPSESVQQAVDTGAANAATDDVDQSVSVVDRRTGVVIAGHNGDQRYNTESILKLFTAAYYLVQVDGQPDEQLRDLLSTMITVSDNGIQSQLWQYEIIPTIAERYGLTDTSNGSSPSSRTWGSDRTTANDQAMFLYRMSRDPVVGPLLMTWMAATTRTAADGFNQSFGLGALTGNHGSKQGWSDPGWSPANLHSVGWSDGHFIAVLQTSATASYATMRATSTTTTQSIADAAESADRAAAGSDHFRCGFGRVIRTAFAASGIRPSIAVGAIEAPAPAAGNC